LLLRLIRVGLHFCAADNVDVAGTPEVAVRLGDCRVAAALCAINEVLRGDGLAVRPQQSFLQRYGVDVAVNYRVALGHARNNVDAAVAVIGQVIETAEHHANDADVLLEV
jgi:hypothetical protein